MPRVAADEKIVLVLAKSSHWHQLRLGRLGTVSPSEPTVQLFRWLDVGEGKEGVGEETRGCALSLVQAAEG